MPVTLRDHCLVPPPFRTYSPAAPIHPGDSGQVGREKGKVSFPIQDRRKGQGLQRTYLVVCIKRKPPQLATPGLPGGQASSHDGHRLFNSPLPRCLRPTRARALWGAGQLRRTAVREPTNRIEAA